MLDEFRKAFGRSEHELTPVPTDEGTFELAGELPAGWIELDVEIRRPDEGRVPLHALVGGTAYPLPPGRRGHATALIEVAPGARLALQVPSGVDIALGRIVARQLARAEAALRRSSPIIWRRLREPKTILPAALKLLRAAREGELLDRLLRRGGREGPQAFYPEWHARYATLSERDRGAIRRGIDRLPRRPVFSVLMPVYDPPGEWLARAIASVRSQLYPDWQLCIADDASLSAHVRRVIERAAAEDPRVEAVFRQERGHISAASNTALTLARGEFSVLLDHDDELTEHALYELAHELCRDPGADLIYTDEDKIDERGRLRDAFFKPDWNPDLLLGQNYLAHLCALRTSLVRKLGGFREGFEGSQDYDLVLRVAAHSPPARLRHVPAVLYHWRSLRASTAHSSSAKSYAQDAGLRAVRDHLAIQAPGARAESGPLPNTHRIRWPLPADPPLVTLIIPTRDGRPILEKCVESLLSRTAFRRIELVVVDNQSSDLPTLDYLADLQRRRVARVVRFDAPFNFSAINNLAVREHARGDVVGLLNNDLEIVEPGWLDEMVTQALRPGIGAVGARLLYPDGTLQHGGILLGIGGAAGHEHKYLPRDDPGYFGRAQLAHDVSAVTAACLVIRRDTFLEAQGFDESLPVAFNDVDFCLRVRALGLRNLWTPFATLVHHESKTRGREDTPERKARFEDEKRRLKERWGNALQDDPAYNPNLSLEAEDFSLAWPPRVRRPWEE